MDEMITLKFCPTGQKMIVKDNYRKINNRLTPITLRSPEILLPRL